MSVTYNGAHSVAFLSKAANGTITVTKSWDDLFLIPASRLSVAPPQPNYAIVSIPGSNQSIDVTQTIPKAFTYGRRNGTWEFYVDHDKYEKWISSFNKVKNNINGRRIVCVLMDDPSHPYVGRIAFKDWVPGDTYSKISVDYTFDYEYDGDLTVNDILTATGWTEASEIKASQICAQYIELYPKVVDQVVTPDVSEGYNYIKEAIINPISYTLTTNAGGGNTAWILTDQDSIVIDDGEEEEQVDLPLPKLVVVKKDFTISPVVEEEQEVPDDDMGSTVVDRFSEAAYSSWISLPLGVGFSDEERESYYPIVFFHSMDYTTDDEEYTSFKVNFSPITRNYFSDLPLANPDNGEYGGKHILDLCGFRFEKTYNNKSYIQFKARSENKKDTLNASMSVLAVPDVYGDILYYWNGYEPFLNTGRNNSGSSVILDVNPDIHSKLMTGEYYPVVVAAFQNSHFSSSVNDVEKVELSFDNVRYKQICNMNMAGVKTTYFTSSSFKLMTNNRIKVFYKMNNEHNARFHFLIFAAHK